MSNIYNIMSRSIQLFLSYVTPAGILTFKRFTIVHIHVSGNYLKCK